MPARQTSFRTDTDVTVDVATRMAESGLPMQGVRLPLLVDGAGPDATVGRDARAPRVQIRSLAALLGWLQGLARVVALLALDFAALFLAIFTALTIKEAILGGFDIGLVIDITTDYLSFVYLVTVLLFAANRLYSPRATRPGLARIAASLTQVTLVTLAFAVIGGHDFNSYYIFYGSLLFALVYVSVLRWAFERLSLAAENRFRRPARLVFLGRDHDVGDVARAIGADRRARCEFVGGIAVDGPVGDGLEDLGGLDDLDGILRAGGVDELIITDARFPKRLALDLVDRCHRLGVAVRVAPSTMELLTQSQAEFIPGQPVPLFDVRPPVFEGVDFLAKRIFDLIVATVLLIFLAPLALAVIVAIKLTSAGPVFYRSRRPGLGGEIFSCFKFRTMRVDINIPQDELEELNESDGALFKIRHDPRLTPIGGFLRRYSVDELPQLWNVMRGEMSLVGPRPLPLRDYERLEDWHRKRYLVLPGITGLWQVSGRADLDFDDLVRLDFLYLERWSPFLDLSILVKTIPAVVGRRGAF